MLLHCEKIMIIITFKKKISIFDAEFYLLNFMSVDEQKEKYHGEAMRYIDCKTAQQW